MKQLLPLFLLVVLCTTSLNAQHMPDPVTPGSKGNLPTVTGGPQDDGSAVPLLTMSRIYDWPSGFNGYWYHYIYMEMYFPTPQTIGADYYVPQVKKSDVWKDVIHDDVVYQTTSYNYCPCIESDEQAYRLRIVGGPYDGKFSNVVEVQYPSIPTSYGYSWSDGDNIVGTPIEAPTIGEAKVYVSYDDVKDYTQPAEYLNYKWYRQNPYNNALTLIENANADTYTPTANDIGYYIVCEVKGDKQHIDLTLHKTTPNVIQFPVFCSTDYTGVDGIILNSEYVLPDINQLKIAYEDWNDDYAIKSITPESIISDTPGRYIIRTDLSDYRDYSLEIRYGDNPNVGLYASYGKGGEWVMIRPLQIYLHGMEWQVTALEGESPTTAEIEVLRYNIDGELVVDNTYCIDHDTAWAILPLGKAYLRTKPTDAFMQTYYPSAASWSDADVINVFDYENYVDVYAIQLLAAPAPLTGNGVIEGNLTRNTMKAFGLRAMMQTTSDGWAVTMLLINSEGQVVATTQVDANGHFKFEHVPYGTYTVQPDVAGYTATATPVTISEEHPTVTEVDYNFVGDAIVPAGTTAIEQLDSEATTAPAYDLSGRRVRSASSSVILRNAQKYIVR